MILKALLRVVVTAAALFLISMYLPGITIAGAYTAIVVALVWGLLGITVRPVLNILALPINIITFGLFSFIINALLFWLLSTIIAGFHVAGFVPALEATVLLTLLSWVLHKLF